MRADPDTTLKCLVIRGGTPWRVRCGTPAGGVRCHDGGMTTDPTSPPPGADRRLVRRRRGSVVAGVATGLAERQIRLQIDDSALALLGEVGFDPVYGARPLKRAIQQQLENPLAQRILAGDFAPGDTIHITATGPTLSILKQ